jgi:hypothetical protein
MITISFATIVQKYNNIHFVCTSALVCHPLSDFSACHRCLPRASLVVLCAIHCINLNMRCCIVMLNYIIIVVLLLLNLHCITDNANAVSQCLGTGSIIVCGVIPLKIRCTRGQCRTYMCPTQYSAVL